MGPLVHTVPVVAVAILGVALAGCIEDGDGRRSTGERVTDCEREVCGWQTSGWELSCAHGVVSLRELYETVYCTPHDRYAVCEVLDETPDIVHTCKSGCASDAPVYVRSLDDYHRFDLTTLCE